MYISVIIPTYNPQAYLWECLNSLWSQTLDKNSYEVILVLNGCKEPYHSKIIEWKEKHSELSLKYIQTDVGGVSNARNLALDAISGEYVTFLDDDDFFSKATLKRLSEKANSKDVIIFKPLAFRDGTHEYFSYSRTQEYDENKNKGSIPFFKVRKNFGGPVMKLFPREIIGDRRYNLSFKNGEDSLFMFLISDRMQNVQFADEDAVYYRRIRSNSAATVSKSLKTVFLNSLNLSYEYTKIYFSNFRDYNFSFYFTRLLGSIKAFLYYKKETF